MHLEADESCSYFTKTKYMNDYSFFFEEELKQAEAKPSEYADKDGINITGRFIKSNFEANEQFTSVEKFQQSIEEGKQLWEVIFMRDLYEEDNDTDEDEEEVDEEVKMLEYLAAQTQFSLLFEGKANISTLKKGFVFFMDQEKAELKRVKDKLLAEEEENGPTEHLYSPSTDFHPISEFTLQANEYHDITQDVQQGPYTPILASKIEEGDNSEETDEEFDWFEPENGHNDECYFVQINKNRKTIQPGQQVYNCYGNRSNKFLMLNYGFCFPDNTYDSLSLRVRCNIQVDDEFVPNMLDFELKSQNLQEIRFKRDQINEIFTAYLRAMCKKSFFAGKDAQSEADTKSILMTQPTNLLFETHVFKYYQQALEHIQTEMYKVSTLEEDLELLKDSPDRRSPTYTFRMAVLYRSEKKKILKSQLHIVSKVLSVLQNVEMTLTAKELGSEQRFKAYTELLMADTATERKQREEVLDDEELKDEQRQKKLGKFEEDYWYRRLINAEYFK